MPAVSLPTAPQLIAHMGSLGYRVFEGVLNLNIVGLRGPNRVAGAWDDRIGVLYQVRGTAPDALEWRLELYEATTDPGRHYLNEPMRPVGTAVLVPGQYRGVYEFGLHRGRYEALVQRQPMRFWRDGDCDDFLDLEGPEEEAIIGCNLHRAAAHALVPDVGRYSAACQVVRDPAHFAALMDLCHHSADQGYGDRFSYTLMDWPPRA
ncbi:MAG: hypothetical protein KC933_23055 [Myxococcales bacterium]|nr:hypothetical protein [Myxococcales bacterium]MCB9646726.1 hypothetical protein [Deltaproteobacteria bacterium]